MEDYSSLGQVAAWHILHPRHGEAGDGPQSVMVNSTIAQMITAVKAAPANPQCMSALSNEIDLMASENSQTMSEIRDWVWEAQAPPKIDLKVLGKGQRLESVEGSPAFGRTLRIALAMRGGVSLAVWIGGCVAELDILRQIRLYNTDAGPLVAYFITGQQNLDTVHLLRRAHAYATLLAQAKYDQVEVDILAGASAGGLNSVLYSVAQRAGTSPANLLLDTWKNHGALQELLNPPGRQSVNSLLQGDDYFYEKLKKVLEEIYCANDRHEDLKTKHLTVELAATIIDSDPSSDPDAEEGRGGFHFEGVANNPIPNQVPSAFESPFGTTRPLPDTVKQQLDRLAYAARSTSSFPGAFEPAYIHSTSGDWTLDASTKPNMRFAFSAHRKPETPGTETSFRVVDGGVFDNIPIGRALAAARTRMSPRPADRALIYLDPDIPADPLLGRSRNERLSRLVNAVSAAVLRLKRMESLDAEVNGLVDYGNTLWLNKGRADAFATTMSNIWSDEVRLARRRSYIRYRSTADVATLTRLLTSPAEWQLTSTINDRRNFRAMTNGERQGLDTTLITYDDNISQNPASAEFNRILTDPQALLDAAQCAFAWLRQIERSQEITGTAPPEGHGELRTSIYELINRAVEHRDKVFFKVLVAGEANSNAQQLIIDEWRAEIPPDSTITTDWKCLNLCVQRLRALSRGLTGRKWTESPWCTLTASIATGNAPVFKAQDLAPALAATGIPPVVTLIRYWRIASNEPPGAVEDYDQLHRGDLRERIQLTLNNPQLEDQAVERLLFPESPCLTPQAKLAGNALGNFSGFLSKEWRENDWWWGRMDTAAGISRFLATLPRAPRIPEPDSTPEDTHDPEIPPRGNDRVLWLQNRVLEQRFELQSPTECPVKRQTMREGAQTYADLSHGYRLLLLSRGLRIAWRALLPDKGTSPWIACLLHYLLSPVLVLLPTAVDPARLTMILAIGFSSLWLLGQPASDQPATQQSFVSWFQGLDLLHPWFLYPVLLLVIALIIAIVAGGRRWQAGRRVVKKENRTSLTPEEYSGYRIHAMVKALSGAAAAILLLAPLLYAVSHRRELPAALCLIAIGTLVPMVHRWTHTVPGPRPHHLRRNSAIAYSGVLLTVAVPPVTAVLGWSIPKGQSFSFVAGALFVVAGLLLHDWLWTHVWILISVFSSVTAAAAGAAVGNIPGLNGPWETALAWTATLTVWGTVLWWLPDHSYKPSDKKLPDSTKASPLTPPRVAEAFAVPKDTPQTTEEHDLPGVATPAGIHVAERQ